METIGIRDLQQHVSEALRRVRRGESLGVTDRGRLVAILAPPSAAVGTGALLASGRARVARRGPISLPKAVLSARTVAEVLDELRNET